MRTHAILSIAASLLFAAMPALAVQNFDVTVGNAQNTANSFSPAALPPAGQTIHVGETITFTNPGGGFHNAHSADANFSFSCGKTGCTAAGVAAGPWTAVVTVPASAAGHTITFICDAHGAIINGQGAGMAGTITVAAAQLAVELQSFEVK